MSGKKKHRAPLIIGVLLFIIIGLPLIAVAVSFVGRITPDSVIPDSFDLYASVPNPVRLAGRVLDHETLPDIMALAELAPLMRPLNQVKTSGLTDNRVIRFAARGRLNAAFLAGGRILAAWDAGIISPLLRILPVLAGRFTVPGLYYVQAGKNSRFEYRMDDGTVFYIGPYKNLLIISNNPALFESVLSGTSREGDRFGSTAKNFYSRDYDIAFLLSPAALMNILGDGGVPAGGVLAGGISSALSLLQFPGPVEASLSILPDQLKLRLVTPLGSASQDLQRIIARNSQAAPLAGIIPAAAQYLTLLSAGSLQELMSGASAIASGKANSSGWEDALRKADSSARMALGMDLQELLFSWTGTQFAVYGLEGRPNPVIAIEIKDEKKRKEVFDKAFKSIFLNENVQLNLDGNRIPRIQIPGFLDSLLQLMDVNVPSPYYTVQGSYLLISESAESLLAAVNAVRRNDVLPRTELWRTLSEDNSGPSSFSIFYSLDRSLPFFLKGSGAVSAVLRLYRQGLARLSLEDSLLRISLGTIPGAGKGIVPAAGYPLDLSVSSQGISSQGSAQGTAQSRAGSRLYQIASGRDTRLLLTRGGEALAVNPLDRTIKEWKFPGTPGAAIYAIPQAENSSRSGSNDAGAGAAWIVDSQGLVSLVNKDLENLSSFPLTTGIQLAAPPETYGGKLFLSGEDGSVYTVNSAAQVNLWGSAFSSALRSPPSFIDYKNKTYAAVYPKSLVFREIFLLDAAGNPLPNWPVPLSGIAFGSPLLFRWGTSGLSGGSRVQYPDKTERLLVAFITQAGELTICTEDAEPLPGFPLTLEGIFYLQPVFDGESLWVIESGGTLYRIELNGEILSQKIPRLSVKEGGYITIADMSGDKANHKASPDSTAAGRAVFFSGEGNALYGYSRNFNSLEGFPLPVWGRPVIGDLNGDGKIEVAGVGMDNRLYMWQFR